MAVSALIARSLARAAIPKLFAQGYSASAAARFLTTEIGSLYRRQTYLADWREITGVEKLSESFRFIPKKYRLSWGLMAPSATPMPTNYRYLFRLSGVDPDTGLSWHSWTSMLDDERLSAERAEQIMAEQLQADTETASGQLALQADYLELYVAYRRSELV